VRSGPAGLAEIGDQAGQANAADSLGYAHHRAGDHERAAAGYELSLTLFLEVGDRYGAAQGLMHLGDVHRDAGEQNAARAVGTPGRRKRDPARLARPDLAWFRDGVLDRADLKPDDVLLDVGCGTGLIGFGARPSWLGRTKGRSPSSRIRRRVP
jgi:predicted TPR repeat methyltransferase